MRTGALVMIDALGFKGIWKRVPPEKVIEKLETLHQTATAEVERTAGTEEEQAKRREEERAQAEAGWPRGQQWPLESVEISFLSDTIVIGFGESPHGSMGLASLSSSSRCSRWRPEPESTRPERRDRDGSVRAFATRGEGGEAGRARRVAARHERARHQAGPGHVRLLRAGAVALGVDTRLATRA
jgi:hypothetical protein